MTTGHPAEGPSPSRRRRRLYEPEPPEVPALDPATGAGEPSPPHGAESSAPPPIVGGHPGVGKSLEADSIVRKYVYWSTGLSLLPVPVFGVASVLGVQLKMLSELSTLYGVPFSDDIGKALIASLGGGLGAMVIGRPVLAQALCAVLPPFWPVLVAVSSTAAASTYAIGRIFIRHYELGGTLRNFRPDEARSLLKDESDSEAPTTGQREQSAN